MKLAVDVQYSQDIAFVAGVLFSDWLSTTPASEYLTKVSDVEEYEPGSFYKRELPCILKLLAEYELEPETIIVDGYVYLDNSGKAGLGKRLYDALKGNVEIIGVAKKAFISIGSECEIYRGCSAKPLYVTSTSDLGIAKNNVVKMYGENRMPVLLKRADQLCRKAANKQRNTDSVANAPSPVR